MSDSVVVRVCVGKAGHRRKCYMTQRSLSLVFIFVDKGVKDMTRSCFPCPYSNIRSNITKPQMFRA